MNELVTTNSAISVEEIAVRLNKSKQYVRDFINEKNIQPVSFAFKGKKNNVKTPLYNWDEFTNKQEQLVKELEESRTGAELGTALVLKAEKELDLDSLYSLQTTINQLVQIKQKDKINQLQEEVKDLQIKLGQDQEYYSTIRVAKLNNKNDEYKWQILKKKSIELGCPIQKTFTKGYGYINSYHISVWKICYPDERY